MKKYFLFLFILLLTNIVNSQQVRLGYTDKQIFSEFDISGEKIINDRYFLFWESKLGLNVYEFKDNICVVCYFYPESDHGVDELIEIYNSICKTRSNNIWYYKKRKVIIKIQLVSDDGDYYFIYN
jgi:hypothetical protein